MEITIESEEDLINLWQRMYPSNQSIDSFYPGGSSKLILSKTDWKQSRIDTEAWNVLEDKLKELGLRK